MKNFFKELWKALKSIVKEYHNNHKSDEEKALDTIMNDYLDIDYKAKIKNFFKKLKAKK